MTDRFASTPISQARALDVREARPLSNKRQAFCMPCRKLRGHIRLTNLRIFATRSELVRVPTRIL